MGAAVEASGGKPTFFERIGRQDLASVITKTTPWISHSLEVYLDRDGFHGQGGLGILMGDMSRLAERLEIPIKVFSLIYSTTSHQVLKELWQHEVYRNVAPEKRSFQVVGSFSLGVDNHYVQMDILQAPTRHIYGPYEPGMSCLYAGRGGGDHRLYQQAAAGFGNYQALKELGITPAVVQLNEVTTALMPLAEFDDLSAQGLNVNEAIKRLRKKYILTNHTLVAAAIPQYSRDQFKQFVFPNMRSEEAKEWLGDLIDCNGGYMDIAILAHTFAGKFNGVSKMHAEIASGGFRRADGEAVNFYPITNGIDLERWTDPKLYEIYKSAGVIDEFDLPTEYYRGRIKGLDVEQLREVKDGARNRLRTYLSTRIDQNDQSIRIPEDAEIACWTKRLADYKRPSMLFRDQDQLLQILQEGNVHIILSGNVHPEDAFMKYKLREILQRVEDNPFLRERVHFAQDYDEALATPLVTGVDIWFNTPEIGNEACGTSWEKALANLAVLVSTEDGGVADVKPANYFQIVGEDYDQEVACLYRQFRKAVALVRSDRAWAVYVKNQLGAYINIISGARAWWDYLNFAFPKG